MTSDKGKPDLPESTLRTMERMVKTPPKPHGKRVEDAGRHRDQRPPDLSEQKRGKQEQASKK